MYKSSKIILLFLCVVIGTAGLVSAGGPVCGDGILQEPYEQCDDGNNINGDGCNAFCVLEVCGDGVLQEALGETCDDGNNINGDGCNAFCVLEVCGDGVLQEALGEQCDDGNVINGDGCSAACIIEYGNEGCKPNYWKRSKNFGAWPAPYTPDTLFSSIFEDVFPGQTLLEVLNHPGVLGPHAVAALLNAASSGVAFDLKVRQVITMFNTAYSGTRRDHKSLKTILKGYNMRNCPLGGSTPADADDD